MLGSGNVPGLCLRRARLESPFPLTSSVAGDSATSSVNKKLKEKKKKSDLFHSFVIEIK